MRTESQSFCQRNVTKAGIISLVLGMALIGLVMNHSSQPNESTRRSASFQTDGENHSPILTQNVRQCLSDLKSQTTSANAMRDVSHSPTAKYNFLEDGASATSPIGSVDVSAQGVASAIADEPHKAFWMTPNSMALVYTNNVVVSVDIAPVCQVTNVYEPTPQNEIHPLIRPSMSEKMVSTDYVCQGVYNIKGFATGAYLNYDTNIHKVINQHDSQIDATNPPDGEYSKWQVEYFPVQVLEGAWDMVYKVRSNKHDIIFKYLVSKGKTEVAAHIPMLSNGQVVEDPNLIWRFYEVASATNPVSLKPFVSLVYGWAVAPRMVILMNVRRLKCLCIMKNGRYDPQSVQLCPCTNPKAVLLFEKVP